MFKRERFFQKNSKKQRGFGAGGSSRESADLYWEIEKKNDTILSIFWGCFRIPLTHCGCRCPFKLFLTKKWVFLQILLKNIPRIFYQNHNFFHTHVNDVTCQFCITRNKFRGIPRDRPHIEFSFYFTAKLWESTRFLVLNSQVQIYVLFYGLKITMNDEKTTQNKVYISSGYAESNVFSKPS